MEEQFELPVQYKGQELVLKASLQVTGYTHKFIVDVNGQNIAFEPDEDRKYRAVIPFEDLGKNKSVNIELLKEIVEAIGRIGR